MRTTVLIPAYNAAHCIAQALDSVMAQTTPVDEVLVVDDGSQDDTSGVALAWRRALPLRVISMPANGGVARALQSGVGEARGDWIFRLDADDRWSPRHVAALSAAAQPGVVLVSSAARWVDEQGLAIGESVVPDPAHVRAMLMWDNPLVHSATAFSKAACLEAGGYRPDVKWEDYDLWIRLLQLGEFGSVREVTMDYTVSSSSVSRGNRSQALQARWLCQRQAIQAFWRVHPLAAVRHGALGGLRSLWRRSE